MDKRLILAAGVLLAGSTAVFAMPCVSLGQLGNCHYVVTVPGPVDFPGSIAFDVPGFDPALGTLTNASIWTNVRYRGSASLTNIAPEPWDIHETFRALATLTLPGLWMIALDDYVEIQALAVPPGETAVVPFGGLNGSPFLHEWTDPGLYQPAVPGTFTTWYEGVRGTGMPVAYSAQVDYFTVNLDYEYRLAPQVTPEPGTAALLAVGLSVLLFRHRRA